MPTMIHHSPTRPARLPVLPVSLRPAEQAPKADRRAESRALRVAVHLREFAAELLEPWDDPGLPKWVGTKYRRTAPYPAHWEPSLEEIATACAEIRATWSPEEERSRRGIALDRLSCPTARVTCD